jgi:epsilon-lactone hydrolase
MSVSLELARAAATVLYRHDRARWADPEATRERMRQAGETGGSPRPARVPWSLRSVARVGEQAVRGRRVLTFTPRSPGATATVLYLHGGAYIGSAISAHWAIVEQLIRRSGATVVVPLYGLAPRHTVDDAIPLLLQLADALGRDPRRPLVVAGDSAGAALAVALAFEAGRVGAPVPDRLLLVSPWLDVELAGIERTGLPALDPMVAAPGFRVTGDAWRAGRAARDPLVSPASAPADLLATLPPTRIVQGGREMLLPSVRRFARRSRDAGADVGLRVYPGGFHDFVGATFLPESRDALRWFAAEIVASVRERERTGR